MAPVSKKNILAQLSLPKLIILGGAGLAILIVVLSMLGLFMRNMPMHGWSTGFKSESEVAVMPGYPGGGGMMARDGDYAGADLSYRNIMPPMAPRPAGNGAEEFETTDYTATIKTGSVERTCGDIERLKKDESVVFLSADRGERNCYYMFKVENAAVPNVVALLEGHDPEDLSKRTETIQGQVRDFTAELEVLNQKLTSIEEALTEAQSAYDSLTAFAVNNGDAEALARAVESKLTLIDRLTQEKLNLAAESDRLSRAKEDQMDRLVYTHFAVSVYEDPLFDGKGIAESWRQALKDTVQTFNHVLQAVTVGLISYLLLIAQIAIYGFILIFIAKYAWRYGRRFWNS